MKITKASAAEVLSQLSPMAVEILQAMFGNKKRVEVAGAERLYHYHNAVVELIARNILRADYDIISGHFVTVLQPGGRRIVELLKARPND